MKEFIIEKGKPLPRERLLSDEDRLAIDEEAESILQLSDRTMRARESGWKIGTRKAGAGLEWFYLRPDGTEAGLIGFISQSKPAAEVMIELDQLGVPR